jgi:hypothetical protein
MNSYSFSIFCQRFGHETFIFVGRVCPVSAYMYVLTKYKLNVNAYGYFKDDTIIDKCYNYYKGKYILHWCRKMLLSSVGAVVHDSESHGTHDQILLSHVRGSRATLLLRCTKKTSCFIPTRIWQQHNRISYNLSIFVYAVISLHSAWLSLFTQFMTCS